MAAMGSWAETAREPEAVIASLDAEIAALRRRGEDEVDERRWLAKLSSMKEKISDGFANSFDRTEALLADQECDLLRAFKARLFDRHQELAALRAIREEKASGWIARVGRLEAELDYARETRMALERQCAQLTATNRDLRRSTTAAAKERKLLIDDLVLSKKRRFTLREELERLDESTMPVEEPPKKPRRRVEPSKKPRQSPHEPRRLWRRVVRARAEVASLRRDHAAARRVSGELRALLRQFCHDARRHVEKARACKPRLAGANVARRLSSPEAPASPALGFWDIAHRVRPPPSEPPAPAKTLDIRPKTAAPDGFFAARAVERIERAELQLQVVSRLARLAFPLEVPEDPLLRQRPRSAQPTAAPGFSSLARGATGGAVRRPAGSAAAFAAQQRRLARPKTR